MIKLLTEIANIFLRHFTVYFIEPFNFHLKILVKKEKIIQKYCLSNQFDFRKKYASAIW